MPKKSKILFLTLILALMVGSFITIHVEPVKAETGKTITVPTDFPSISSAVGNATEGDTIVVRGGVYHENLVINKSLRLESESNAAVIDGLGEGTVVWVNADNVVLSGFKVRNSGDNFTDSGIYVNNSNGVRLLGNTVTENNIGVYLTDSPKSLLRDNELAGNSFNFGVYSSSFDGYVQDIDQSNTVEEKPMVYLVNTEGKQAPTNAGYVAAVNCTDITVSGVVLERNWQNLLFAYTRNSKITDVTSTLGMDSFWLIESRNCNLENNNIIGNIWGGIALVNTVDCTFQGNTFKANGGYGLFLSDSSSNQFFHNNFVDNPYQAWLHGVNSNSWDKGYPSGGNYWSNYTGVDLMSGNYQNVTRSDGLGDTPVTIAENNVDNYPLMSPWMQPNEPVVMPIEFSVTGIIAVSSILAIFIAYFIKNWRNRKQAEKTET
jgi:parallel beta-helix repeat protein